MTDVAGYVVGLRKCVCGGLFYDLFLVHYRIFGNHSFSLMCAHSPCQYEDSCLVSSCYLTMATDSS